MFKPRLARRNICYCSYQNYCRFCHGSGMIECLSCKYDSIQDFVDDKGRKLVESFDITVRAKRWKRWKKCKKCSKGWVECPFCGGNGKSHQIF